MLCTLICVSFVFTGFAQNVNLSSQESAVYNQHKEEIDRYTQIGVDDQMTEYIKRYSIKSNYSNPIRLLLTEREQRLNLCNFLYPDSVLQRYNAKQSIQSQYNGSIDKTLLLAGAPVATENINSVVKISEVLKLSNAQIDTIATEAVALNNYIKRHPHADVWAKELALFNKTLSTSQVDLFLSIKNGRKTNLQVRNVWQKLKESNMTSDLDSIQTYGQLYSFYNNLNKAGDLYYKKDSIWMRAVQGINASSPLAVKRYNLAKKKRYSAKSNSGTYMW